MADERIPTYVIEDDEDTVAIISSMLADSAFFAFAGQANSPTSAQKRLEEAPKVRSLVLIDGQLLAPTPGNHGEEIIRSMRANPSFADWVVFSISRRPLAGADEHLGKLFTSEQLDALVRKHFIRE